MKQKMILAFIFIVVVLAISWGAVRYYGNQIARHTAKNAEIALVLGNAVHRKGKPNPCLRSRVAAGVALYQKGQVGQLLMSGGMDSDGSNEAESMYQIAVELGVPADKILLENQSQSTYENIVFSQPLLQSATHIILVSDAFHLPRAAWLAERYWQNKQIQTIASGQCGDTRVNHLRKEIREVLAWIKAMLLY